MTRTTLIAACVATAALACAALTATGATAQQGGPLQSVRAPHCSLKGAKTIKANRYVRVFEKVDRHRGGEVYGCVRTAKRAFHVGYVGDCHNADEISKVEVAGRRAVLGIFECSLSAGWWRVDLVNLRNGKREFSSSPISLPWVDDATFDRIDPIDRIVVTGDGAVAWTAARTGTGGVRSAVEVRRRRRGTTNRAVLLDSGLEIDPKSLRRRGRTITWTKAGVRRSAQL